VCVSGLDYTGISLLSERRQVSLSVVTALALAVLGCSSSLTGHAGDAGADAAGCGCVNDSIRQVLSMSLDCLCAAYACEQTLANSCQQVSASSTMVCGIGENNGLDERVYDATGALIGVQLVRNWEPPFECPGQPSLNNYRVRAGQLPDASCTSIFPCGSDGGAAP